MLIITKITLVLGEGPTQGLDNTVIAAAKILLILKNQDKYLC